MQGRELARDDMKNQTASVLDDNRKKRKKKAEKGGKVRSDVWEGGQGGDLKKTGPEGKNLKQSTSTQRTG